MSSLDADLENISRKIVGFRKDVHPEKKGFILVPVSFGEFITPYAKNAETMRQVYDNLAKAWSDSYKHHFAMTLNHQQVGEQLYTAALEEREQLKNAIIFVQAHGTDMPRSLTSLLSLDPPVTRS